MNRKLFNIVLLVGIAYYDLHSCFAQEDQNRFIKMLQSHDALLSEMRNRISVENIKNSLAVAEQLALMDALCRPCDKELLSIAVDYVHLETANSDSNLGNVFLGYKYAHLVYNNGYSSLPIVIDQVAYNTKVDSPKYHALAFVTSKIIPNIQENPELLAAFITSYSKNNKIDHATDSKLKVFKDLCIQYGSQKNTLDNCLKALSPKK